MKLEDLFKDEDAHDYVPKPVSSDYADRLRTFYKERGIPTVVAEFALAQRLLPMHVDERRFPPRIRQPGPPEGQDYFTLTAQYGRPQGFFEKDKPR